MVNTMKKILLMLLITLSSFSVCALEISDLDCKSEWTPTINISLSDIDFNIYHTIEIDVYEKNNIGSKLDYTSIFPLLKGNQTLTLETGKKNF